MILCCAIFSYSSVSDIKGEFLVEFFTPERPHYVRKLLDRPSMLTEGISMVNSRLVNVSLIYSTIINRKNEPGPHLWEASTLITVFLLLLLFCFFLEGLTSFSEITKDSDVA